MDNRQKEPNHLVSQTFYPNRNKSNHYCSSAHYEKMIIINFIKLNLDNFGLKLFFIRTILYLDQRALSDFYIGNNVYLSIIYSLQQTAYPVHYIRYEI